MGNMTGKKDRNGRWFWILAFIIIILDQITKFFALKLGSVVKLIGPLQLNLAMNTGTLFSLFSGNNLIFIILSIVIICAIICYREKIDSCLQPYFGLVLGGGLGNLIDRLHVGQVIDFIDLNIWSGMVHNSYITIWPIFNVADMAISIGIVMIIYLTLKEEKKGQGDKKTEKHTIKKKDKKKR
ncbi:signal peptidase II [Candidatus Woesearchaeota archaeon]|nr:signal peptidase II [Candidatus Woesearchaeota archaeon]HIH38127.1 signal peptidase II [Candidatus Woesearchaeota archaeon]HIJ04386.1 signal peptidase II [Candidatus Woesearchaeota archaeon]